MSEEGKKLGLIDAIVPSSELLKVSRQWTLDIAERRKPWMRSFHKTDKIGSLSEAREEAKVFKDLVLSDTSKGLVHVFLPNGQHPRHLTSLILASNLGQSRKLLGLVSRKKLPQDKADKALSMVKGALDFSDFKDVDMVIEAVIENVPLKQKIFSEIEKVCPPHCILETNTSTISLNVNGENTISKDRIIGAHFFSPAHIMPLLEIGAHILVNVGVDVYRIDAQIAGFGHPMGPFQLQDLTGYGVAVAVGKEFGSAFSDCTFKSPLIDLLIESGRNGKNYGKGYYIYEKGRKPRPDLTVLPIIEESRRLTKIMPGGKRWYRFLADTVGAGHIYRSLKKWSELYGNFFKPSRFLEERATKGIPLSVPASTSSACFKVTHVSCVY
ncbi:hypothetical protein K7X08_011773 [Anisodus acutangulus]|uniref:Uncharacterized protein n=1 Tax=Anisodus acutangulus TaxID=402998 RepID=A0A9Q1MK74_9SOLA|nr:hypothetical protein K7X08_011773 [Anisodus acutangulus]